MAESLTTTVSRVVELDFVFVVLDDLVDVVVADDVLVVLPSAAQAPVKPHASTSDNSAPLYAPARGFLLSFFTDFLFKLSLGFPLFTE
jgi:hypothetical protein